jgi:hypothetical protein
MAEEKKKTAAKPAAAKKVAAAKKPVAAKKPAVSKKTTSKATEKKATTTKAVATAALAKVKEKTVEITHSHIAERAYHLFLEGSHDAHENWLRAEQELKKRFHKS